MSKRKPNNESFIILFRKQKAEKVDDVDPRLIEDDGFVTVYPEKYKIDLQGRDIIPAKETDLES